MSVRLLCRDCLGVMAGMADGEVDHILTDPPYGDKTHNGARTGSNGGVKLVHFDSLTVVGFLAFCAECVRVARRWVVMTCEWQLAAKAEDAGLPVVRLGVWIKPNGAPQFTGDRPGTGWEAVLLMHREGRKRWNGGGHHAVWTYPKIEGEHPTQKPLPLVKKWIVQFTDEGETVFDPMMGSGTTGVAAVELGRNFIGCEVDPTYFAIAEKRLGIAQAQLPLFAGQG